MRDLRKGIRDYLMLRRGLGFKLVKHEAGLEEFASFLERKRGTHITSELALEWATLPAHHQPCQWTARLTIVRGFARYWSATDPLTEVPPLGLLPYRPTRARPYFYSDQEIQQLLKAAKARPSCDPLRPSALIALSLPFSVHRPCTHAPIAAPPRAPTRLPMRTGHSVSMTHKVTQRGCLVLDPVRRQRER